MPLHRLAVEMGKNLLSFSSIRGMEECAILSTEPVRSQPAFQFANLKDLFYRWYGLGWGWLHPWSHSNHIILALKEVTFLVSALCGLPASTFPKLWTITNLWVVTQCPNLESLDNALGSCSPVASLHWPLCASIATPKATASLLWWLPIISRRHCESHKGQCSSLQSRMREAVSMGSR